MKIFGYTLGQIKKTVITVAGFTAGILTAVLPFIPDAALPFVLGVIGVATTVGVFLAKNTLVAPAAVSFGSAVVTSNAADNPGTAGNGTITGPYLPPATE